MENINYSIVEAEALINRAISGISAGTAYYILRAKMYEVQKLYYDQASKEYEIIQSKMTKSQDNADNDLAPATQEEKKDKNN